MIEKIDCVFCNAEKSIGVMKYTDKSYHGVCGSCGKTLRIEDITDFIDQITKISLELINEKKTKGLSS